jgi:hypothetical protein
VAADPDIEDALEWIANNAANYNILAVNMSLGTGRFDIEQQGPYGEELEALADLGIVTVAAGGNGFFDDNSALGVSYPATHPDVLAVGAVWAADRGGPHFLNNGHGGIAEDTTTAPDRVAAFTQRDPALLDVLAPGTLLRGAAENGGSRTLSGTSQAAAVVSGIVVLAQQVAMDQLDRLLTPVELRTLLKSSGDLVNDGDDEQDNVINTNVTFPRVNMMKLAEAIVDMATTSPPPVWQQIACDMNADGKADLILRDKATGDNKIWLLDGDDVTSEVLLPAATGLDWSIVGAAEFTDDNKIDLLWRNDVTGQAAVWVMDGTTRSSVSLMPTTNTDWRVGAVGDFNDDGDADIVWRNHGAGPNAGKNAIWIMDDTTRESVVFLPTAANMNWVIAGAANFDSDDTPDILWRNTSDGNNAVWLMDGLARRISVFLPSTVNQDWQIIGVCDSPSDPSPHIYWRNATTDGNAVWLLNETQRIGVILLPASA